MALTKFTCPDCGTSLQLARAPTPGARIKCPKCKNSFDPAVALTRPPVREEVAELADEPEESERRPRHKRHKLRKKESSSVGLIAAAVVIGSLVVIGGGVTLIIFFWPGEPKPQVAAVPPQPRIPPNAGSPFEKGRPGEGEPRIGPGEAVGRAPERPAEPAKKEPPRPESTSPPPADVPQGGPRSLALGQLNLARLNAGEAPARAAAGLEAVNYVPSERGAILGVDLQSLAGKLVLAWLTEKIAALHEEGALDIVQRETSMTFKELDHVVAAGKLNLTAEHWKDQRPFPFEVHTYVVKTRNPYDRAKVLQQTNAGTGKRVQGKEYFPLPESRLGRKAFLFLPTERIMVVSSAAEDQLGAVLSADGSKPRLAPDTLSTIRALDGAHAWAVISPEVTKQEPLAGLLNGAKLPAAELAGARALGVGVRFQGDQIKLAVALHGAGEAGGRGLTAALQEFWNKQGKAALEKGRTVFPAGWHGVATDLASSLQFQSQGEHCNVSGAVSLKSLDQLLKTLE